MKRITQNSSVKTRDAIILGKPGLTVIGGNTNSGKTAIFRAIRSLILNPASAKHHIRDGEKKATVILEIEGEPKIGWLRTLSDSNYIVDGTAHSKCGRAKLEDICPEHNLRPEPDKDKSVPNIQGEEEALFPFEYGPSDLFKVFERVFCLDDSASILALMNQDQLNLSLRRTQIEETRTKISTRLKAIVDLNSMITSNFTHAFALATYHHLNLSSINSTMESLEETLRILPPLISLSSFKEYDLKGEGIYKEEELRNDLEMVLTPPPGIPDWEEPRPIAPDFDLAKITLDLHRDLGGATRCSGPISLWTHPKPFSSDYSAVSDAVELTRGLRRVQALEDSIAGSDSLVSQSPNLESAGIARLASETISSLRAIMDVLEGLKRSGAGLRRYVTKLSALCNELSQRFGQWRSGSGYVSCLQAAF